jgi:hypothetical protein
MSCDNRMSHINPFESNAKAGMLLWTFLAGLKPKLIPSLTLSIICFPWSTCDLVYAFLHILFLCVTGECWVSSAHDASWPVVSRLCVGLVAVSMDS